MAVRRWRSVSNFGQPTSLSECIYPYLPLVTELLSVSQLHTKPSTQGNLTVTSRPNSSSARLVSVPLLIAFALLSILISTFNSACPLKRIPKLSIPPCGLIRLGIAGAFGGRRNVASTPLATLTLNPLSHPHQHYLKPSRSASSSFHDDFFRFVPTLRSYITIQYYAYNMSKMYKWRDY